MPLPRILLACDGQPPFAVDGTVAELVALLVRHQRVINDAPSGSVMLHFGAGSVSIEATVRLGSQQRACVA